MYELQEFKTSTFHIYYYFLIDCTTNRASGFYSSSSHVTDLLLECIRYKYIRHTSIGTISKSQLSMYLAINPDMKIKDLILLLERSVPADAQGE